MLLFSWMSAVTYIFYFIILVRTVSSRLRKKLAEIYGYFFGKWNKLYSGRHNGPNGACPNKIKNVGYLKTFPLGRRWINNQRKSNSVWYNALHNLVPRGRDPFGQKTGIATSGQVQHWKSAIHGQIWLVQVSIYCVCKAIQNPNVVGPGQGSRFPAHDKRDPWGRGCALHWKIIELICCALRVT